MDAKINKKDGFEGKLAHVHYSQTLLEDGPQSWIYLMQFSYEQFHIKQETHFTSFFINNIVNF